jgi:hypothetical protein
MDAAELRQRLESVGGSGRYRVFLRALNRRCRWHKRFMYWQEALLAKAGVVATSATELFECAEPLLRICELHGAELQPDPEALAQRCRGAVTEDTIAQGGSFPNTDCGPLRPGEPFENCRHGLWFCPECRAAEARWRGRMS